MTSKKRLLCSFLSSHNRLNRIHSSESRTRESHLKINAAPIYNSLFQLGDVEGGREAKSKQASGLGTETNGLDIGFEEKRPRFGEERKKASRQIKLKKHASNLNLTDSKCTKYVVRILFFYTSSLTASTEAKNVNYELAVKSHYPITEEEASRCCSTQSFTFFPLCTPTTNWQQKEFSWKGLKKKRHRISLGRDGDFKGNAISPRE